MSSYTVYSSWKLVEGGLPSVGPARVVGALGVGLRVVTVLLVISAHVWQHWAASSLRRH